MAEGRDWTVNDLCAGEEIYEKRFDAHKTIGEESLFGLTVVSQNAASNRDEDHQVTRRIVFR